MPSPILRTFRALMHQQNINFYILPRTDQHQNQHLSPSDQRVQYLSGFSGSNAITMVSQQQALLWTDARYWLQAQTQLHPGWRMQKLGPSFQKWYQYLSSTSNSSQPKTISIDSRLITSKLAKKCQNYFTNKPFNLQFNNYNLVDRIWINKPSSNYNHIYIHQQWAGKSLKQKITWIRIKIQQKNGNGALFTNLGQIAWILNLRSSEIPFTPFFKSILIIGKQSGTLYLPKSHVSLNDQLLCKHLLQQNISLKQYDPQFMDRLLCQQSKLNYSIYSQLKQPIQWQGISLYRAKRTQKQIAGYKRCHIADGCALIKFFAWRANKFSISESEAAQYLDKLRKNQTYNKGLSFETISAAAQNSAVIHYHTPKSQSAILSKQLIYLVDSGGQYLDGTTDVTRTFHFGTPTPQQKDIYTRVLLGNLDIERLKWPSTLNLTGKQIDILARRHLWKKGYQYKHGTGHGVGYFGQVHEQPVGISSINNTVLQKNMIVTNQPGYYQPGKFGIRIQNILVVRQVQTNLLGFQNLTLCPYDNNLIDISLLSAQDITYINIYHHKIWQIISPLLNLSQLSWLRKATKPIQLF